MKASNLALKVEIKTVSEELEEIKDMNGGLLDPAMVVEYASSEDTALHKKFTWDDTKAAGEYRIWQARQIIRLELVVIRQDSNGSMSLITNIPIDHEKTMRAFVSLPLDRQGDNERGYRDISSVMQDSDLREQLLESAKRDMSIFRRKYGMLEKLAKVFAAMDEI